jgi:1,4-alpha-glucan branching enzyme
MVYQIASPKGGHIRALFELPASLWAQSVFVVGDFDEKGPVMLHMRQERDGNWRGMIDLPIGQRYEFRYLIDGRWCCDSHANSSAVADFAGQIAGSPKSLIDTMGCEEACVRI